MRALVREPIVLSKEQLCWLAGYLEGEGTFVQSGRMKADKGVYSSVGITVSSVDKDVIQKVADMWHRDVFTVKCYTYDRSILGDRQEQYRVNLYGMPAVRVMVKLLPLMGQRRREQINKTLTGYIKLDRLIGGIRQLG